MDEHLTYELSLLNIDYNNSDMAMQDLLNLCKQSKQQVDVVHTQLVKLDGEYSKLYQSHSYLKSENHQLESQINQLHLKYNKLKNELDTVQVQHQQAKKSELAVRQDMQFIKSKTGSDIKRKDLEIAKVKEMTIKTMKLNVKKDFDIHFNKNYSSYIQQKPVNNIPDAYQSCIDMLNERNAFLKQELSYYKSLFSGVLYELPSEYESKDPQIIIEELVNRTNAVSGDNLTDKSALNNIIKEQNRLLDLVTSADFEQVYHIDSSPDNTLNCLLYDKNEWSKIETEKRNIHLQQQELIKERMEFRKMVRQEENNRVQFMMNLVNTPMNTPHKKTPARMHDYSTPLQNRTHNTIPFEYIKNRSVFKESRTVGDFS
eukprot:NODE_77_length_23338_cov_0.319463.p6 type:complete len:372 gc:universal NODE_77_length_23338_cov_0.319463:14291-13176(-)